MDKKLRILTVMVVLVFAVGLVLPQPAHAFSFGSIGKAISGAAKSVGSAVSGAVSAVKDTVVKTYEKAKEVVKSGIKSTVDYFTKGGGINEITKSVTKSVGDITKSVGDTVSKGVGDIVSKGTEGLSKAISANGKLSGMLDKLSSIPKQFVGKFSNTIDALKGMFGKTSMSKLSDRVMKKIGDFSKMFGKGTTEFTENVQGLLKNNSILEKLKTAVKSNPITTQIEGLQEGLSKFTVNATNVVKGSLDKIKGACSSGCKAVTGCLKHTQEAVEGMNETIMKKVSKLSSVQDNPQKFNEELGTLYKVDKKGLKSEGKLSFAGFNFKTTSDVLGMAKDSMGKNLKIFQANGYFGPHFENETTMSYLKGKGKLDITSGTTLGLDTSVEGNVKWNTGNELVNAKGHGVVVAGLHNETKIKNDIKVSENFANQSAVVIDTMVGAGAKGGGKLYVGKMGGEFALGGEARVGAWVDTKGSTSMKYKGQDLFTLKGEAGAGLGVGIGGGTHFSFRLDRLGFGGKVTLGPFKLGGGAYVNPKAVAELAWDKGGQAVKYVKDKANVAVAKGKKIYSDTKKKVSDAIDKGKKAYSDAKKKAGKFVSSGVDKVTKWLKSPF